ncbi:MAG: carboxylesterase family protein [Bacteroidia bacterium]|nr:carboxylesterase family protein [Bacteroidia bacterium]
MNIRSIAPICCLFFLLISCEEKVETLDIIRLEAGSVSGTRSTDGQVLAFQGIPYAKPPVGELRWRPPQAVEAWTGIKACTSFGPSPMQQAPTPFMMYTADYLIPASPISEDCLTLNVWTPATTATEKLPVFVWIYGGGFVSGGSAVPIYDGEEFAKKGVVFVSVNYRVGIFGFFSHPDLTAESPFHASGNYGLMDQLAALRWIQKNIAAFGGNPDQVIIAGQSAGSMSVNALVASPLATSLFHGAIGESGASGTRPMLSRTEAESRGLAVDSLLGNIGLKGLRALSADTLLAKAGTGNGVVIDGYVLPKPVRELMTEGNYNDVPLITGWNANEGFLPNPKNSQDFIQSLKEEYGPEAAEILLRHYPAYTDAQALESQSRLSTHLMFGLPDLDWAEVQSGSGKSSVFLYYFDHTPPGEFTQYKAHHTAEVPYALSTLDQLDRPWEPVDLKLEDILSDYWVNFAKTGNPNGPGLPVWVEYESADPTLMQLSSTKTDVMTGMVPVPHLSGLKALRTILTEE